MDSKKGEARKCANTNRASIENNLAGNIDMNIVAKSDLNFHGYSFNTVSEVGAIWLTSTDLAKALGYKKTDAVSQIYARNADEFSDSMTTTLNMRVVRRTGDIDMNVRAFSLRGAHLIAMFATTDKAKEFRRWVLDILDREVAHSPIAKQFTDEEIINLCYMQRWMEKAQDLSKELYPAMKDLGSKHSGIIYDMAHETRYITSQNRQALLREASALDTSIRAVSNAEGLLKKLRSIGGVH